MKTRALALILSAAVIVLSSCKQKPQENDTAPGVSPGAATVAPAQKKAEVWTCPMHPQIRKDGPGQCPICGMNLVKVDAEEEDASLGKPGAGAAMPSEHAPVSLSFERRQLIGVRTGVVEKKPLFKTIKAAGRLAFDPELYTAQNEYIEALRQQGRVKDSPLADVKHSADRMVQSSKLRLKILGLSDSQIAGLSRVESSDSNLLISKPGSQVWIYAEIFEMDLPSVQPGQSADITASFLGGQTLAGKVVSVDRVINPATRTAKARIIVTKITAALRPESYVEVSIRAPLGTQLVVPFDAVLDTGTQAWVFVVDDKGKFHPRLVTVKYHAGDEVAVASGLSGGEKIVTSANFLIDSESRLKAVAQAEAIGETTTPSCPKGERWHADMGHCMKE